MFRQMLGWLVRWATGVDQVSQAFTDKPDGERPPPDTGIHFGPPATRNIFRYWDGEKAKAADPMVIWERVVSYPADLKTLFAAADRGDAESIRDVCKFVCDVLNVQEFDAATGKGLTRDELNRLIIEFYRYVTELKKKHVNLPTPLQPSVSTSSPEEPPVSTTPPDSDCCSTETASNVAEPITP